LGVTMEGEDNEDYSNEGKQLDTEEIEERIEDIPEAKAVKRKDRILPLIVMFIIGLIIGIVLSPYVLDMFKEEETPIYQQYERIDGDDTTIIKSEELDVQITGIANSSSEFRYYADYIDIEGRRVSTDFYNSPETLLDIILFWQSEGLSWNQIKLFEYICRDVLK